MFTLIIYKNCAKLFNLRNKNAKKIGKNARGTKIPLKTPRDAGCFLLVHKRNFQLIFFV